MNAAWGHYRRAIAFTPDHGGHIDPETSLGTHGLDIPDNLRVEHYWGIKDGIKD